MHVEYEEFESIEDMFLYLSAAAAPLKNTIPVSSYKSHLMSFIPLGQSTGEAFLMIHARGDLDPGIYSFDVKEKKFEAVESVERTDRVYFFVLRPRRSTIADAALKSL